MSNLGTTWQQLSQRCLRTEQVRAVDQLAVSEYGMHSLVLMENAALNAVQWLQRRAGDEFPARPRTVVLCGSGNNGGDGLAMARHLRVLGWPCTVFVAGGLEKLSPDARANAEILLAGKPATAASLEPPTRDDAAVLWWDPSQQPQLELALSQAELVIDAMLGTGARGNPRPPLDTWIRLANASRAYRVAVDIPTGVDAESGEAGEPQFDADATLTFVARKPAMGEPQFAALFGEVAVLPIGVPEALLREVLSWLEERS